MRPCPECGTEVSDAAVVCPRCGFPLRRDALNAQGPGGGGGGGGGSNAVGIILLLVFGGLGMVVVVGILAALAIPRFSQATQRTKEREADLLLKQAYALEQTYLAEKGEYARTFQQLESVGWSEPAARYYFLRIVSADTAGLCIAAVPKSTDVESRSINRDGAITRGDRCEGGGGEGSYGMSPVDSAEVAARPGEAGEAGAVALLGDVYASVREYHARKGRYPTSPADLLRHVHDTKASAEYMVTAVEAPGTPFCVAALPRPGVAADALSADQDGGVHRSHDCSGAAFTTVGGTRGR
jgi:type IV pilus assembly protein PilE